MWQTWIYLFVCFVMLVSILKKEYTLDKVKFVKMSYLINKIKYHEKSVIF